MSIELEKTAKQEIEEESKEDDNLFNLDRPVIKGYPELRWTDKRPYTQTQYYPAILRN